ncbi:DUF952 domain-containing protein [Zavarzinia compransoris]|uniref:DUF952 domain-containing protein n=1 Tax=Zavarzinia marina TaxID=2911065 RepID=UPI001F2D1340|nr:DUF952 domain-containing protein [Zavarzinia marina]MCF4166103.1 DUF952 domain-containing protein [Zavarzinia marina]
MTDAIVYKVMDQTAWNTFQAAGTFAGAAVDVADGFIHFSAAHQVRGTLDKHFAGATDLWLVAVDTARLGPALKWEVSRGGDLFPHLYASLNLSAVIGAAPLPTGADGRHDAASAVSSSSSGGT